MTSTVRANTWSVTLNFKTVKQKTCDDMINNARAAGWKVTGQEEKGEENPHYQLMVQTPQVRFSAVKKMFPTGHIEVARNRAALAKYVTKEDTRVAALPEHDEKYVTASRLWDMIYQVKDKDGWWDHDYRPHEFRCYKDSVDESIERDPLAFFDKMIGYFIREGYFVDMLACNPAIRSFWKKFWRDILYRSRETDKQTDRQSEKLSHGDTTTNDGSDSREDRSTDSGEGTEAAESDGESYEDGESEASSGRDESSSSQADADDDW